MVEATLATLQLLVWAGAAASVTLGSIILTLAFKDNSPCI
jgi:hypothetical protein